MAGLLDEFSDFVRSPEGQGLLAAGFGGLAGAQRGAPINSIGRAGLAGLNGYGNALDRQQQLADAEQLKQTRGIQLQQAQMQIEQQAREQEKAKKMEALIPQFYKPGSPAQPASAPIPGFTPVDGMLPPDLRIGTAGKPAVDAVAPSFDMAGYAQAAMGVDPQKGLGFMQAIAKDDKPLVLSEGQVAYDPRTKQPILSVPKAQAKPSSVQAYEYAKEQGYPGTLLDFEIAQKRAGASSTTVNMTDGQKGFENEMKLGGAFKQEPIYKDHAAVQSAFNQINAALAQGSPISDTAAATKIMKILDPGSVVRESELGMAMAAGGRMDRLKDYVSQALNGTKLTPQQRQDFGNLATELTAASAQTYNQKRSEYLQQGNDYGLNAARALGKEVEVPSRKDSPKSTGLSVTAPNGKTYVFNSERELANWKMATGVK
jgi:hypothetical protein